MKIPGNHQAVMPYLILEEAESFIEFTKKAFNAELIEKKVREGQSIIRHAEINISGSIIMFAGATDQWKTAIANLFVYVDNADDTYKKAISAGASTVMELSDQDYGRTCGVLDPAGNTWWITSVK